MGRATQDLINEHQAIVRVLEILDAMMASAESDEVMLSYYGEVVGFLKIFADTCHHGKEENFLFTAMVAKGVANEGGPIGAMLAEHVLGRQHIAAMNTAVEARETGAFRTAAIQYRDLLSSHIDKENQVLFPLADRLIGEKQQDEMFKHFEEHEETVIGHGVHEKLHAMIDAWAAHFG